MIFIPGNVPSSKNSKVKASRGVFNSPAVSKYLRRLGIQTYNSRKKFVKGYVDTVNRPNVIESFRDDLNKMRQGKDDPILIGYHHVRNSKRKFDFSNTFEVIQDLFTAHNFIVDDNMEFVIPSVMTSEGELPTENNIREKDWYSVDKENPGVWVKIF